MERVIGFILVIVLIFGLIVFFFFFKSNKSFVWYVPTLILWLISIIFFIMAKFFALPMQDLGYLVMAMITGIASFLTLIVTLIISKFLKK